LRALVVCQGCVVQRRCLDYALRHQIDHGIWGGMCEGERRHLRRCRDES
jgi:WhiB family redox-sensing transcriptional regulator